jgi:uncharacterized paraquat-inducible protein A
MKIRRRCVQCLGFFDVEDTNKAQTCPKCRSRIGRARQKSIQKSAKKKKAKA